MSAEWDGLRAAAEAAVTRSWTYIGSGASREEFGHKPGSSATYVDTSGGATLTVEHMQFGRHAVEDATYIAAASPDVVLGLLDRLEGLEAIVDRVKSAGFGWTVAAKHDLVSDVSARDLAATLGEVLLRIADDAAAPLSASGAESDHGGRGDGEGLG